MTLDRRWLFLPPAVALLLVLGPLSMQPAEATTKTTPTPAAATPAPTVTQSPQPEVPTRSLPAPPRTPDLWQVGSTLLGVLLLGGVGIAVLRRLRAGPSATGSGVVTLRQTLRLSARQAVHALEFDGRLLLVGEHERGLALLHANSPAAATADALATGGVSMLTAADEEDDGAVPRDLVLPRPQRQPAPTRAPADARSSVATRQTTAAVATPAPKAPRNPFTDFRALLAKAGR